METVTKEKISSGLECGAVTKALIGEDGKGKSQEKSPRNHFSTSGGPRKSRSRSGSRRKSVSKGRRSSSRHHEKRRERNGKDRSHRRGRSSSRSRLSSSQSNSSDCQRHTSKRRRQNYSSDEYNSDQYEDTRRDHRSLHDSYKHQDPNHTVMVRGMESHLVEDDIRQDLFRCGILAKDIRLIRDRDTGMSRGFAFVEFSSVGDAVRWMDKKQGLLVFPDKSKSCLMYSYSKASTPEGLVSLFGADWICENCNGRNFRRREICYKCTVKRPSHKVTAQVDDISSYPTNTILLHNLDILTTEEGVLEAIQSRPYASKIPIKGVKISKESETCLSRGLCYVETNNVSDATFLFNALVQENLEVDGRIVSVDYGRSSNTSASLKNKNAATLALAAAQWTNNSASNVTPDGSCPLTTDVKTENDVEKMAHYCASAYAKTPEELQSYLAYYRHFYFQEMTKNNVKDSAVTPLTADHPSTQNPVVVAASGLESSLVGLVSNHEIAGTQQAIPLDANGYQFNETRGSGYCFDRAPGLYFDSASHNVQKQQLLQFQDQNYMPFNGNQESDMNSNKISNVALGCDLKAKEKTTIKVDKVKAAKIVAKKMEKWAKTLNENQKKVSLRQHSSSFIESTAASTSVISTNDRSNGEDQHQNINLYYPNLYTPLSQEKLPFLLSDVTANSNELSHSTRVVDELDNRSRFVDERKLACLLCKRRFNSREILQKHVEISELHKKNLQLEALRSDSSFNSSSYATGIKDGKIGSRM